MRPSERLGVQFSLAAYLRGFSLPSGGRDLATLKGRIQQC